MRKILTIVLEVFYSFFSIIGLLGSFSVLMYENSTITASSIIPSPADACSSISANLVGKIALINRASCSYLTQMKNVQASGALAVLVLNTQTDALETMCMLIEPVLFHANSNE